MTRNQDGTWTLSDDEMFRLGDNMYAAASYYRFHGMLACADEALEDASGIMQILEAVGFKEGKI